MIQHFQRNAFFYIKKTPVVAPVTEFKIIRKVHNQKALIGHQSIESIFVDVTNVISQFNTGLSRYVFVEGVEDNRHYYLDCHVDLSLLDIWEDFFKYFVENA